MDDRSDPTQPDRPGTPTPAGLAVPALRILLVEDNEDVRAVLAETLEGLGHAVCATASSESEAVTAVERILLTGRVPHIFITGARPEYLANGVAVLRKPFREAELDRSIEAALKLV